jgi:vancomycin resistance protein YoaR
MIAKERLEDGSRAVLNFPVPQIVQLEDGSQAIEIDHEYHFYDEVRQDRKLIKQYFDDLREKLASMIRNAPLSQQAKAILLGEQGQKLDDEMQRWMDAA